MDIWGNLLNQASGLNTHIKQTQDKNHNVVNNFDFTKKIINRPIR